MALTIAQLISLCAQDANCPAYLTQAGQKLNLVLQELAQSYNFSTNQGWLTGTFFSGIGGVVNTATVVAGSGPYQLPSDFLRFDFNDFFWQNGGINYFPTPMDIDKFDELVQQQGFATYPSAYTVDMSTTPPGLYVWPAPSAAYPYFGRYHRQVADIANPATNSGTGWFPDQMYIQLRLTAELMLTTGDQRHPQILGLAMEQLNRFMQKEDNRDTRAVTAKLDPRHFGPSWNRLPSTKVIPW